MHFYEENGTIIVKIDMPFEVRALRELHRRIAADAAIVRLYDRNRVLLGEFEKKPEKRNKGGAPWTT